MGFWGIEVKPGKPYPYHSDNVRGKLHITQATLGLGSSTERCIVQCSIGHKNPIFLCSLLPNKNESCTLNLEFENDDDLVAFSVIGQRSIHLSGYFVADEGDEIRDDYESDSFGEDIANTETDSSEYDTDDEYDDDNDFIVDDGDDNDDDLDMYSRPIRNSGVVIEEIVDDEEPKVLKRKNESSGSEDNAGSQQQIVARGDTSVPILESEDEDGFPISTKHKGKSNLQKTEAEAEQTDNKTAEKMKKKKASNSDTTTNLKRKVDNIEADGHLERPKKEKKKKKKKQAKEEVEEENADEEKLNQVSSKIDEHEQMLSNEKSLETEMEPVLGESTVEKKKKKKKNKKKTQENEMGTDKGLTVKAGENQNRSTVELEQNQTESKSSKVRTFANGLVIEELAMGKPDGKRASPGKQVSVRYIGKLQKNGKIFDSNVGGPPFKFRLGLGQVISGWDVGVNGMRVGDKRRLTIPPSMGYGAKGAGGGKIPPNAWLLFDVELVDVR